MLSNGTPWDTTAGEEVCVCWNLEPRASMYLRVFVSVSYVDAKGAKVLRDLTLFRRLQTFRSCNVCHIVSLCCLVPTRKRWLRSWKISLLRIWRCHLIPSLLIFAACSLAFLLVGLKSKHRPIWSNVCCQAWPPDQDDVDGRLKRLFEGCADQLLPANGSSKGKEARTKKCFFLGPACFWVLVFSPILRCDLEWCFLSTSNSH